MNITSYTVTKIVKAKPRTYILIQNLTDSSLYISKHEFIDTNDYEHNSIVIKKNGLLEINPCVYQGDFYGLTDVDSDVRVLEL